MQKFVYEYATKVYFGEGAAEEHLAAAISDYGKQCDVGLWRRIGEKERNL